MGEDMELIDNKFMPKLEKVDINKLYEIFNDNDLKNDFDNLLDIFYNTIDKHGDRIAIIDEDTTITYKELDEYSDRVALYLDKKNSNFKDYVIVKVHRDWKTVAIIMGILKTKRAYVPIQSDAGEERIKSIMDMTGEQEMVESSMEFPKAKKKYPRNQVSGEKCAYVIFTSGSTGKPKGVRLPHISVAETVQTMDRLFGLNEFDRILGVSELTFDLSVFDLFGTLAAGASLVIVKDNRNLALLEERVSTNNVTFINAVPSVVKMLLEYVENTGADFKGLQSVRNIILSGDVVPHSLVIDILKDIPFVNLYISGGPTEICVWSNYYLYEEGKSKLSYVPYGCSIANKTMYVMKDGKLVDMEEGEIVSGGAGLAIDYIKDTERTNKQFKNNKKLGRLYYTGDRGILTKEGIIQICGRMDNQVKINGFRVELEEIECILNGMDEISQSISCVKKEIEGDDKLVTGIMLNQGKTIEVNEIKSRLRQHVPEYAIPSEFIFLEKLPLSANNKVDRKAFTAMVTKEVV